MDSKAKSFVARTVDEYLSNVPEPGRGTLQHLREVIKAAAPEAEELISYQIPTYKYKGMLVHFAAFKNHCGFYGVNKQLIERVKDRLPDCEIKGTTIRFKPALGLPDDVVSYIVAERMRQNEVNQLIGKKKY